MTVGFRAHAGAWPWMRAGLFVPYDGRNCVHADRLTDAVLENEELVSDYFYFLTKE